MSKNNWYSTDGWYAPLHAEPEKEKARGTKHRRLSSGWRLGIGITLLVGLIVLSSVLFSDSGADISFESSIDFGMNDMPDDWHEYFDSYYTEVEGGQADINVEKAEKITNFELKLLEPAGKELDLEQLYEKCAKSTVSIMAYVDGVDGYYWGTGMIISTDGLVLTNAHIIEGCDSVSVKLFDESEYDAKLVGADSSSDLAVLKIDAKDLPAAEFGDSAKIRVGEKVAAIGNPLGEEFRMTLTDGIISAIERGVEYNGYNMSLLQTNTALNEGNSGGPLFNMYGQVVGVTNMKMRSSVYTIEGIALAIPSSTVELVVNSLIEHGQVYGRPSIGIVVGPVFPDAAEHYDIPVGLYVSEVYESSDAYKKGIQPGDVITHANGEVVDSNDDVLAVRNNLIVGDSITFTVWRDGESFDVEVILVDSNNVY